MRISGKSWFWLSCIVAVSAISAQAVYAQPPSMARKTPSKVGDVPVAEVLERLGAKLEPGAEKKELDAYSSHFDRSDPNKDGKHTKAEYVDNGGYMTPQARAGIFRAADGNADGVVTRAEYVLNRVITDEAKTIVQGMDDDKDGSVERAEFVKHAAKLLADRELAEQVYAAFDANTDGSITIPEYLRVWGQWARVGQKPAKERIAARRTEFAKVGNKPDKKPAQSPKGRPAGGPPSGRPGAGAGPPSAEAIFARFDKNRDGKLTESEVPAPLWNRLSDMDADDDGAVTPGEFGKNRNQRPPADPPTNERSGGQTTSNGLKGIKPAPKNCPACAMGLTAEFVFKRLDVNEDKFVTATEFRRSPGMNDEAKAREAVGRIDKSGDGKLSWEELKTAYETRHANCEKPDPATLARNAGQLRPDGRGDGNRFAQVFIMRSDQNGDGKIEKSEFRGGEAAFQRMDKNKSGFIEADELGELHQRRLNDPKTMKQRLEEQDATRKRDRSDIGNRGTFT